MHTISNKGACCFFGAAALPLLRLSPSLPALSVGVRGGGGAIRPQAQPGRWLPAGGAADEARGAGGAGEGMGLPGGAAGLIWGLPVCIHASCAAASCAC